MNNCNYLIAGERLKEYRIETSHKGIQKPKTLCLLLTQWPSILTVALAYQFKNYKRDGIFDLKEYPDERRKAAYAYYNSTLKKLKKGEYKLNLKPQGLELL